jgi:hypothetical protein
MPLAGVETVRGIEEDIALEAIRETTLAYCPVFISRYFKDEKGDQLTLKEFQLKIIDAVLDPAIKRLLVLLPAGHTKTTLVSRFISTYCMVRNRNIRIMHIMNNSTDAEQNLAAIQRDLLDTKGLLHAEHGPFRGDIWRTSDFHIAGRTIVDKEPTFAAYGTGSNVFGHRSDLIICDDILNLTNSGPQVTDAMRQSVRDWFFQGVMKVLSPEDKIVVVGTVMDFRDLYHELVNNPAHGFKVIHMKAILDEDAKEVLWPERYSYDWLWGEREADPVSFSKRYQNEAIEAAMLTFPRESIDKCRDMRRGWGQITPEMVDSGHTVVIDGFDPTSGQTGRSKWCGFAAVAFNPTEPHPRELYVLELQHFRAPFDEQIDFLIEKHLSYKARATVIEFNGAHQYLGQSRRLQEFKESGHVVMGHYTDVKNKPDPTVGLPNMAEIIKATRLHFPYGDEESRRTLAYFFNEEFGKHPMSPTTDGIMALWFCVYVIDKLYGRYNRGVVRKPIPFWARRAGLPTPDPTRRRVVA